MAQACGKPRPYLWKGDLTWARCPRGSSRPRTAQARTGRAFSFAFSFSCGKAGVEEGGGSALAPGTGQNNLGAEHPRDASCRGGSESKIPPL